MERLQRDECEKHTTTRLGYKPWQTWRWMDGAANCHV